MLLAITESSFSDKITEWKILAFLSNLTLVLLLLLLWEADDAHTMQSSPVFICINQKKLVLC